MDIVSNRPLFTVCASTLLLLFGLNFVLSDCTERVGLVTANTLITNQYVWNLVTACFYEKYIVKLVFDLVALLFATKALPIPSIEQFGLYFLFSVIACTIGTSTYSFVVFFTMANETSLITPMYGFTGVLIAILMFARHQYRGESVHSAFPKLTYHHLPILLLLTQVVLYFAWCKYLVTDLPFSIVSLFFSWSYLRFYYKHGTGEEWGDKSEDFSFVAMFPEVCLCCVLTQSCVDILRFYSRLIMWPLHFLCFCQALHIVLIPFTTAFYNIVALVGLFPALDPVVEKKTYHHLRYTTNTMIFVPFMCAMFLLIFFICLVLKT